MPVSVKKTSNLPQLSAAIAKLAKARVLVGIPQGDDRQTSLEERADSLKLTKSGKQTKMARKLLTAAESDVSNAELLYIHTNGSPMRGIPARPVLQPAIKDATNKAVITKQLAVAAQGAFAANEQALKDGLGKAGTAAANAAKNWFTNPNNNWAPNSPLTIERKGSDRPLIDTGQLRRAITYIVDEDGTASAVETVT